MTNGTGVVQPLTQLFRVKAANDVARAEAEATRGKARGVEDDTALRVHQIYYRILIADVRRRAVLAKIQASEDLQRERVQQVRYGSALEADLIESRAHALQARQELLTTELQRSDLQMQLNDVIGLPLTTPLLLDPNVSTIRGPSERCERDACVRAALDSHPEIAEARAQVEKAAVGGPSRQVRVRPGRGGVRALQLPEQRAVPGRTLRHGRHSRELSTCSTAGESEPSLRERETQLAQAKENLARISDEVELRVQTAYNKMERTRQMVAVSEELLALRGESRRVAAELLAQRRRARLAGEGVGGAGARGAGGAPAIAARLRAGRRRDGCGDRATASVAEGRATVVVLSFVGPFAPREGRHLRVSPDWRRTPAAVALSPTFHRHDSAIRGPSRSPPKRCLRGLRNSG